MDRLHDEDSSRKVSKEKDDSLNNKVPPSLKTSNIGLIFHPNKTNSCAPYLQKLVQNFKRQQQSK